MWPYRLLVLEEETTSLLAKLGKNIACGTLFCYIVSRGFSLYTFYRKGTKCVRKQKK